MLNGSRLSEDRRNVMRIIYEKATFGASPTTFTINGDDREHPCQWATNPALSTISFSDGTVIHVAPGEGGVDATFTAGSDVDDADAKMLDDAERWRQQRDVETQSTAALEDGVEELSTSVSPPTAPDVDISELFKPKG